MTLLLHGIIAESERAEIPEGPCRGISNAGLTAVAAIRDATETTLETVLAFGEVVEALHRRTTIIPIRYGTLLADEAAVTAHLAARADHYRELLAELAGCDEMGIRLPMAPPASGGAPLGGRDYLLALKRKYIPTEPAEAQAAALSAALAGLYRRHRAEVGSFNRKTMDLLSYLVPRGDLPAFQDRLAELSRAGALDGQVSGPWPPYNFV